MTIGGLLAAASLQACSGSEFDPDFMASGKPSVLQVRVCPPDQGSSNPARKVVTATYSGTSLTMEVVDGEVLGPNLTWSTSLCYEGTDGRPEGRANEAAFLVRQSNEQQSAVVRVSSWGDSHCGDVDGGRARPVKSVIVDLGSVTAGQCVTVSGSPPVDSGADGSDDADASETGDATDGDVSTTDSGTGDADAEQ